MNLLKKPPAKAVNYSQRLFAFVALQKLLRAYIPAIQNLKPALKPKQCCVTSFSVKTNLINIIYILNTLFNIVFIGY